MDDLESNALITDAQQFLHLCTDADMMNRQEALEDLRFSAGDQWPVCHGREIHGAGSDESGGH